MTLPGFGVDDLQVKLTIFRVEDEDRTIYRLCGEISLIGLVNCDSIDVCVVDEPDNLIAEKLNVVRGV